MKMSSGRVRIPSSPLEACGVSIVCYWQEQTCPGGCGTSATYTASANSSAGRTCESVLLNGQPNACVVGGKADMARTCQYVR
jgi:hypothetical protein